MLTKFDPFLTQIILNPVVFSNRRPGIDGKFSMDYMGAAEFEFGALPAALKLMKKMREDQFYTKKPVKLRKCGNHEIWFIGNENHLTEASDFFADQVTHENPTARLCERTNMNRVYEGNESYKNMIGWWMIRSGCAMFRTEDAAQAWLDCLTP